MNAKVLVVALVAAGVIGTGAAAYRGHLEAPLARAYASPALAGGVATPAASPGATSLPLNGFSEIVKRAGPAVVNVSVNSVRKTSTEMQQMPEELREFFRGFGGRGGQRGPRGGGEDVPMRGQGSGFIVSTDGYILTNAHVVENAESVTVRLTDRREFKAKVVGSDKTSDVAVLKIESASLPTVRLGKSAEANVGEWVVAIGSPFGFENTVTAGIVSAKSRSLPDASYTQFIQTDVAVNPGNSGGPLFNTRGEVVGINSQIFSRTGGYQGLSFAIPIELASRIKDQIVATGKASHARLGVAVQEVNQTLADSFKLDKPEGALVSNVDAGGPADMAGLKTGDVIRKVNGQPIVASGDLPALIGQSTPGEKVTLEVWRQGKREELSARLGDASDKKAHVAQADEALDKGKLGLALRPLQPQEKRQAGVDGGLVVENAAGPAALAGVQPGDLLMGIDGKPVQSIEQVRQAMAKSGKSVALLIQRDGNKIFVPVRIG